MSDIARGPRSPNSPAPSSQADATTKVYRSLKPGEIGPARMNPVHEERAAANAQIQRSLKAWRSASSTPGKASIPKGAGAPLPSAVRAKMEPKLGADLGSVRVHTGSESADAAKGFGARAFTVGEDVHFNAGEFNPGSKEGDKLLAHELTHVVQGQKSGVQRKANAEDGNAAASSSDEAQKADSGDGGGGKSATAGEGGVEVSDSNEAAEKEADETAEKISTEEHGDDKKDAKGDGAGEDAKGGKDAKKDGAGAQDEGGKKAGDAKGADGKGEKGDAKGGAEQKGAQAKDGGDAKGGGESKDTDGDSKSDGGKGASAGGDAKEAAKADSEAEAVANGAGGDAKTEEKPALIAAKLEGAAFKVFRVAAPMTTPPPQPWPDYVNGLSIPAGLKPKALAIGPADQDKFKGLLAPEQESYLSLTSPAAQAEFLTFDNSTRAKVRVLRLEKTEHFDFYNTEGDANVRKTWRDLTPDERNDLTKSGMTEVRDYLTNSNGKSLDRFRRDRNLEVLRGNPTLLANLAGTMGLTDAQTEDAVSALSAGAGGERVRRVMADTGFENPADKLSFLKEVWTAFSAAGGAKQPIDVMWEKRPGYVMKGKLAKNDAAWSSVPIAKAISLASIGKWGTLTETTVNQMAVAAKANPGQYGAAAGAAPTQDANGAWHDPATGRFTSPPGAKRADQPFKDAFIAPAFPPFAKGSFSKAMVESYTIAGARGAASYFSADMGMVNLVMAGAEDDAIIKACAIDESPEYQSGFIVVRLPDSTKNAWAAKAQGIRRPTAIDGLGFDQFKDAGDDSKCLGVTSGGMPEVVVEPVPLANVDVIRS